MDITDNKPTKAETLKRIWDEKKGKIAVIATATTIGMLAITRHNQKTVNGFLAEHNLMEDFWKYIGADEDDIEHFKNN